MTLTIGDTNRDGSLVIVDTNWDYNGSMRVTVRETIGHGCYTGDLVRNGRRLARKALHESYIGETKSSRVIRQFVADGCDHVTYLISRLD